MRHTEKELKDNFNTVMNLVGFISSIFHPKGLEKTSHLEAKVVLMLWVITLSTSPGTEFSSTTSI